MRIFIYSRKSKWTGRGESVENQISMCRDYIQYNIEDADKAEIIEFEDEGYSGKNTKRPQFQKMMKEIEAGNCNYLVCYKLDRLGRNIADLANMIETLNKLNVSFISIKERFDTSTPIGKAMIYFAGVLAQMEREQIAERVRDNMIMLARKGRWLGGVPALGYSAEAEEKISFNGKVKKTYLLVECEEEMKITRFIFSEYLKRESLMWLVKYFASHGILTKRGKEYTTTAIKDILSNPVYCIADKDAYDYFYNLGCQVCMDEEEADGKYGLIGYAKTSSAQYKNKDNEPEKWIIAKGKHKGIVSGKDFVKIQNLLARNKANNDSWRKVKNPASLLSGLLYCTCGHLMRPKNYSSKQLTEKGERKFSYICPYKDMTHGEKCSIPNVQGNTLDELVCKEVLEYAEENSKIHKALKKAVQAVESTEDDTVSTVELLDREIQVKKKEVQNLIHVLAASEAADSSFIQQIRREIEKLNEECKALEKEREEAEDDGTSIHGDKQQIEFLLEQLAMFKKYFDSLTVLEKREYLRIILDRVVWDGEQAHIFIYGSH